MSIVDISLKLLALNLSDQFRTLEVLKLTLQLKAHAEQFAYMGGLDQLIRLFVKFFSPEEVILSSLKSLLIEVFIALSYWKFSSQYFLTDIR